MTGIEGAGLKLLTLQLAIRNNNYSIYGHRFLANRAECFLGTKETFIYRFVMRNHDFDAFLKNIIFLAGNWAWPSRWRRMVLGIKS